jgi:acetolactate decarboxylase
MNKPTSATWRRVLVLLALATMCAGGCSEPASIYQVSTLGALMQGAYDGQVPCADLPRYGTLGIGTFDALDGELIMFDGHVYQAAADGAVVRNPRTTVPFADVVRFEPDVQVQNLKGPLELYQLLEVLDARIRSKNLMYAVRIDGRFSQMKVRSVPRQSKPYPPLVEAAARQQVFDLQDVYGTVVGLRFPQYMAGVNMPGWHLHFISSDRRHGGHVLGLKGHQMDIGIQTIRRFEMVLPASGGFVEADLGKDMSGEIHQVER